MNKINIGLIGYGNVGSGVIKFLHNKKKHIKEKCQAEYSIKAICDLQFKKKKPKGLGKIVLTANSQDVIENPNIDVIVELIGGLHPAKEFILSALKNGKHVVTANKAVIASYGKELFAAADKAGKNIYYESAVMAGVPIIKTLSEGVAGNEFTGVYGIINGTCNYILSEMTKKKIPFAEALKDAQEKGYAEPDPTLDINGMDSTYKLAILIALTQGKFLNVKSIYTEGITHISKEDIEYAESMGLAIKLLAIA